MFFLVLGSYITCFFRPNSTPLNGTNRPRFRSGGLSAFRENLDDFPQKRAGGGKVLVEFGQFGAPAARRYLAVAGQRRRGEKGGFFLVSPRPRAPFVPVFTASTPDFISGGFSKRIISKPGKSRLKTESVDRFHVKNDFVANELTFNRTITIDNRLITIKARNFCYSR